MGMFDDYITSLEGQEIEPLEVASKLHELHNREIGTREAKITEQTQALSSAQEELAKKDAEITKWKARNFDLSLQTPASKDAVESSSSDAELDGSTIRIKDLFTDNVRNRHGNR